MKAGLPLGRSPSPVPTQMCPGGQWARKRWTGTVERDMTNGNHCKESLHFRVAEMDCINAVCWGSPSKEENWKTLEIWRKRLGSVVQFLHGWLKRPFNHVYFEPDIHQAHQLSKRRSPFTWSSTRSDKEESGLRMQQDHQGAQITKKRVSCRGLNNLNNQADRRSFPFPSRASHQ